MVRTTVRINPQIRSLELLILLLDRTYSIPSPEVYATLRHGQIPEKSETQGYLHQPLFYVAKERTGKIL